MRFRLAPRILPLAIALAATGAAASPSARLVYARGNGAESCPSEGELRKAVALRLGYDPFFGAAPKTVLVQVARGEAGYRGKVQIIDDEGNVRGERELGTSQGDCRELSAAMALAISIAIDDLDEPEPVARAEAEPPVQTPPREPEAPPVAPSAPNRPAPGAVTRATSLAVSAGPAVSFGTAPAPALGASLAAAVRYGSLVARLDGRGELPAGDAIVPNGRVSTNMVVGALSGCFAPGAPVFCLGAGAGYVWSRTSDISSPRSDGALVAFAVGRVALDLPLSPSFFVEPLLEGGVNLTPHRVTVDGSVVYRIPDFSATFGVHLGRRFF